ncbi:STAS domain-containing protein [Peribacillus glennii]|uniref:STAS domain-containing protein n=1 Tax=Peribacillus glennii TaxID=2303991 RepID=A0A372LB96_9BACI|nr:STAS domain-containing protein [Peribacillus glennii]RFU63111.1 STAS domain-containing protein [Peribacillus glennii]
MTSINQQLYEYIIENSSTITQKWFNEKSNFSGEFYSNNPNPKIDKILREQHALTIKTIAYAFLEEESTFHEQQLIWADTVAQSRIENNTPIHDVLEALSKTRETIWEYVETFVNKNEDMVTTQNILKWSNVFNAGFDRLLYHFSERYYQLSNSRLTAQQSLILELSTPVIPISEGVAVLPIVGDIDTTRARSLLEIVPQKCSELGINQLFIDVSGVSIVDTMVANEMFNLIKILDLLGMKTNVSGIRPEVAQTSIQLGLDWSGIRTFSSLKQALAITGVNHMR